MEASAKAVKTQVAGACLWLHPYRAAYWPDQEILLLADLHLGKVAHFRREGLAVPVDADNENWDRLIGLLLEYQPSRVLFLGDLFHSTYNREWDAFSEFLDRFTGISFELVIGNHDILPKSLYERANIKVHADELIIPPFCFTHHPQKASTEGCYNLAGHTHPCVFLSGSRGHRTRLPCFYFGRNGGILPAFGAFTGMAKVKPQKGEQVYVIAEDAVVEV